MVVHTGLRRRLNRPFALLAVAGLALAGCSDGSTPPVTPVLPGNPPIPAQYRGAAWQFEVSPQKRSVKIIPPTGGSINAVIAPDGSLRPRLDVKPGQVGDVGARSSLLGAEVVDISVVANSFVAGPLNNPSPGKRLISFDIRVNNKLNGVDLIAPTFPTPPAATTGPVLFPFEITTVSTSGGATGGAGSIVVVPPRGGAIAVTTEWDGAPHNFFNDVGCGAGANDCFRWEEFTPISALNASNAKKIGFEIDASVGDFTVKVILAADLRNASGPAQSGTVAGTVTSPQLGALTNVPVNVSGGYSGTTAAGGAYSIANVGTGSRTVSLGALPSGCVAPTPIDVTVTNGATSTASFTVQCQTPVGTIGGTITSSLGGPIANVGVVVTPTGGSALPAQTSNGSGVYSVSNVPVGAGTGNITLTNLPALCTHTGTPYTGLTASSTITVNITVTCTAAPQVGTVTGTVTRSDNAAALTGVTVTATPTGGSALAGVATNGTGVYSIGTVPVGGGNLVVSGLPSGCTHAGTAYSGVTNGGTVTQNITVTCTAPQAQYQLTGTWGAITNTGPTGRQVTLTIRIDMGGAPGNPAINGANSDSLVAIGFTLQYTDNSKIVYGNQRTFLQPDFDINAAASPSAGLTNVSSTSGQQLTLGGAFDLVRITYNIATGVTGTTVTPTAVVSAASAGAPTSATTIQAAFVTNIPTLTIP